MSLREIEFEDSPGYFHVAGFVIAGYDLSRISVDVTMAAASIPVVADEGRRLKACLSTISMPVVMCHSELKGVVNFALGTPDISS